MATEQKKTQTVAHDEVTVKVEQPKHKKHSGVTVLLEPDDLVRDQVGGFVNFLREYAVVGLAIGFIVGQEANGVVKQLVVSFIDPWIQVLFGANLSTQAATLHHGTTPVKLPWGAFVYTAIEFVFVMVFIYAAIKLLRLDKLKKR